MQQNQQHGKPLFQTPEEEAVLINTMVSKLERKFPGYKFSGRIQHGAYHIDVVRTVSGDSLSEIHALISRNLAT